MSLLSGDAPEAVAAMAAGAGIEDWHARLSPAEILAAVEALQREGKHVAVVGDGLNDAPVLARGDVSFAMGQGADLAKISADVVLLNDRLTDLIELFDHADRTRAVVRQNFAWAIGYNLLALPAAVIGMVPPWLAALGMCASSLVVSLNALRLLRSPGRPSSSTGTEPTAPTQVAPAV